jgi:hypothetical protein
MAEPAETRDVDIYDIPAAYQERVLKFLTRDSVALEITAAGDAFYVTARRPADGDEKPSYSRSLEEAMNDAMRSRATKKYITKDFQARVHDWLTREAGKMLIGAAGNEFGVTLQTPRGTATGVDDDLEVAIVFAEEELDGQVVDAVFEPPALPEHEEPEEPPEGATDAGMAANARPPGPPPRNVRRPMSARRIVEREEARTRREERPFDPEARREHYARSHHFAVNERRHRGRYAGTTATEDDYVIWRANQSGRFFVDHIGRGGTHVLIGAARGYDDIEQATAEIGRHAHQRGTHSAIVFVNLPSGELQQIGNTRGSHFDWSGRRHETRAYLRRHFGKGAEPLHTNHGRGHADKDILREVMLGDTGYVLVVWDAHRRGRDGKSVLGYAFYAPGASKPLFEGEDFSTPGVVDSDEVLRGLLGFLTLRPGDTDREYFASYTKDQLDFAETDAEELQMFAMEPDDEFEPLPLVDVA